MNKSDLDKIAVAIIEKYGTEKGAKLLTTLLQEINKPAEVQIIRETQPIYPNPLSPAITWDTPNYELDCTKIKCESVGNILLNTER